MLQRTVMQRRSHLVARVGLCCCVASCILKGARAAVVTVPSEAHGHVAYLSCGLGAIEIAGASYGGWVNSRRVVAYTCRAPITESMHVSNPPVEWFAARAGTTQQQPPVAHATTPGCRIATASVGLGTITRLELWSMCKPKSLLSATRRKPARLPCAGQLEEAQRSATSPGRWPWATRASNAKRTSKLSTTVRLCVSLCVSVCVSFCASVCLCVTNALAGAGTWGWSFVLVVVLGGGLYAGGGWAMNHRLKGLDGMDALPHVGMWREVISLAQDGIRFAQARIKGRSGYVHVAGAGHSSGRVSADREVRHPPDRREDAGKRGKESKRSSKASSTGGSGTKSQLDTPAEASQAAEGAGAGAGAQATVKSSASAAGGRWVHVPT